MTEAAEHPLTLEEALGWVGAKVDAIDDSGVGRVEGAFVDASGGEPAWLVIRLGRFGRRTVVPFAFAAGGAGRVWIPCPRQLIKGAPEVDPAYGLDREPELGLCEHYGIPGDAGRPAAIADRGAGERTAVPAR